MNDNIPGPTPVKLYERAAMWLSKQQKLPVSNATESPPTGTSKKLKWALALSIFGNLALATWLLATPTPSKAPPDLAKYTQQDLSKASRIIAGMKRIEVAAVMGDPAVKEISGSTEEWHYCKTGSKVDEYIAVAFKGDSLSELQYYTVSWLDIAFHYVKQPTEKLIEAGGMGDCRLTVRWGTFNQKTPSYPVELPARVRNADLSASVATGK
jgi:outer membrane protein assembly factor BamE (lipoprotein component of BamABCDE complex)